MSYAAITEKGLGGERRKVFSRQCMRDRGGSAHRLSSNALR